MSLDQVLVLAETTAYFHIPSPLLPPLPRVPIPSITVQHLLLRCVPNQARASLSFSCPFSRFCRWLLSLSQHHPSLHSMHDCASSGVIDEHSKRVSSSRKPGENLNSKRRSSASQSSCVALSPRLVEMPTTSHWSRCLETPLSDSSLRRTISTFPSNPWQP